MHNRITTLYNQVPVMHHQQLKMLKIIRQIPEELFDRDEILLLLVFFFIDGRERFLGTIQLYNNNYYQQFKLHKMFKMIIDT